MDVSEFPNYSYFAQRNIYSASSEGYFHVKIIPDKEQIKAAYWYGAFDDEHTDEIFSETFAQSREGYQQMLAWVQEQYHNRRRMQKINTFTYEFIE